ncbi:hypothetical protein [Paenibacillus sp. MER 99-2]|uniref:hypothetical protein n=1 Tax=Paenibacillus sp. MER 99-2 TaxID=2939572 RepID=UPI00203C20D4|nr:hypothetical protein [Paenibacillus sp. MER 99-2]MCM3176228.1 hypothetical protein [Paenibacillus sp. MER 99-2]
MDNTRSFFVPVISFIGLTLAITMIMGEKFATGFVTLVLMSIILINSDKVISFLKGVEY